MFGWGFLFYWLWVGVVIGALSFFGGAPEPILGYAVVTLIMVIPLFILEKVVG